MAFPATPLDLRVQLFYDDTWNKITSDVRGMSAPDGRIVISRGRPDEAAQTRTTTCRLALSDKLGKYNPLNPSSVLFGKIDRNTRLRVSVGEPHVGAADFSATDATNHVAPSVVAASAGLLVCAWIGAVGAENYTVPGAMTAGPQTHGDRTMASARQTVTAGATGTRTATVTTATEWNAASVLVHGASVAAQESLSGFAQDATVTLTTATGTQVGWWLVAVQAWGVFPQERVRFMPDAPNDNEGGWVLLADSGINRISSFNHQQMRIWARRVKRAGAQTVRFFANIPSDSLGNNDNHAHMLVLSGVADWWVRAVTEVAAFAPRWDVSGSDVWVPVEGAGVLRRIEQGAKPLASPIRRLITSELLFELDPGPGVGTLVPVAYWPLEDGAEASSAASGFAGSPPMQVMDGTIKFGSVAGPAGSATLPDMLDSTGNLIGTVSGLTATSEWVVGFLIRFEASTAWTAIEIDLAGGPYPKLRVQFSSQLELFGVDDVGTATSEGTVARDLSDGRWYWFEMLATETAGTVFWKVRIAAEDGSFIAGSLFGDLAFGNAAGTETGPITQVTVKSRSSGTSASVGHVSVWPRSELDPLNLVINALDGYAGETAGRRLERLAGEHKIAFHPVGDLDQSAPMGPQTTDTLPVLLRRCEAADLGVLFEPRQEHGIAYRTRRSLYNQVATLGLNYAANETWQPLEPVIDDQQVRNDVTVERSDATGRGGSARAVDEGGPLGVDTVGRYDTSVAVNVASDLDLPDQAGWRLHLGTVDEARFPTVRLLLQALAAQNKTALEDAAAALDLGDLLSIDNPPAWLAPDDIMQLTQGFTEILSQFEWEIATNNSPASPYQVAVAGDATLGRVDTAGSETGASFVAGTDTSLSVAVTEGALWTTDAAGEFPNGFDVELLKAGRRWVVLHVTAIAGASSPQTFTVNQTTVNGITATIPSGTVLRLAQSAVVAL